MKVVLFCGGYGTRMRSGTPGDVPKPMQLVGPRPLIWHVMRYYAHFGHTDFVLCLGYGAHHIKDFFLNYQETTSNDFVLRNGHVELLSTDISDWSISFVQTGMNSPIGERLRRVRDHLEGEEMFLANYADVLTDAPLPEIVDRFTKADAGASMMVVPPPGTFHCVDVGDGNLVGGIAPVTDMPLWVNGGYFVLRQEIFDHIPSGGDLVGDGCVELAKRGRLLAYPHRGYWKPTDTVKERIALDEAYSRGDKPWALWENEPGGKAQRIAVDEAYSRGEKPWALRESDLGENEPGGKAQRIAVDEAYSRGEKPWALRESDLGENKPVGEKTA